MDWNKDHIRKMRSRAAIEEYDILRRSALSKKKPVRRPTKAELRAEANIAVEDWERFRRSVDVDTAPTPPGRRSVEPPPWED